MYRDFTVGKLVNVTGSSLLKLRGKLDQGLLEMEILNRKSYPLVMATRHVPACFLDSTYLTVEIYRPGVAV